MSPSEAIEVLQAERESIVTARDAAGRVGNEGRVQYWQDRVDAIDVAIKALEPHIRDELIQNAAARASDLLKGV